MFDQNLHLLTQKLFYILIFPSNDFRSMRERFSQNTRGEQTQRERERERYVHRADRRLSQSRLASIAIDDRDRDLADRDLPIAISPFVRI